MARNERAQWAQLHIDGVMLLADLAAGASLARLLDFAGPQLRCFGAPPPSSVPLEVGDFNGRVVRGGSWEDSQSELRSAARTGGNKDDQFYTDGLRVARSL